MNYKIYYKTNGRITGILENSELAECQTQYESDIEYDSTLDLDSEKTKENIFFECHIVSGALVDGVHTERVAENNLKQVRNDRSSEYPSIGDQLDALFHAGVFLQIWQQKYKQLKISIQKVDSAFN